MCIDLCRNDMLIGNSCFIILSWGLAFHFCFVHMDLDSNAKLQGRK